MFVPKANEILLMLGCLFLWLNFLVFIFFFKDYVVWYSCIVDEYFQISCVVMLGGDT